MRKYRGSLLPGMDTRALFQEMLAELSELNIKYIDTCLKHITKIYYPPWSGEYQMMFKEALTNILLERTVLK